jgi:3-oxoacid CoA-transferase subunit B
MAYIDVTPGGLVLKEIAPGTSVETVQTLTEPVLRIDPNLRRFRL